jgi:hypothetical protein
MEHMEDKIIRDKIDSLHSLPAGYAPSIDSKWELLETALQGKKKNNIPYYLAIAATLLLLFSIGWIMLKSDKSNVIKNDASQVAVMPVQEKKSTDNEQAVASEDVQSIKAQKTETAVNRDVQQSPRIDNEPEDKEIVLIPDTQIIIKEEVIAQTTTTSEPKKIQKKKRYVEMQFAPSITAERAQELHAGTLKIKLFSTQYPDNNTASPDQEPVALRKSL